MPSQVAQQIHWNRLSDNRVLVELVEQDLEAQEEKEKKFLALAERFRAASDPKKVQWLGDEMWRFLVGDHAGARDVDCECLPLFLTTSSKGCESARSA